MATNENTEVTTEETAEVTQAPKRAKKEKAPKAPKAPKEPKEPKAPKAPKEPKVKPEPVAKARNVYKRQGILHVCANGGLYAPNAETTVVVGEALVLARDDGESVSLTQGETTETWFPVTIPTKRVRKPKAATVSAETLVEATA